MPRQLSPTADVTHNCMLLPKQLPQAALRHGEFQFKTCECLPSPAIVQLLKHW
jgi:hypothetical protein